MTTTTKCVCPPDHCLGDVDGCAWCGERMPADLSAPLPCDPEQGR